TDFSVWLAEPSLTARWVHGPRLTIDAGLQASLRDIVQGAAANAADNPLSAITAELDKYEVGSGWLEALWRPTPRLLIRPGLRLDSYSDGTTARSDADPRLTVRYRLFDRELADVPAGSDDRAVWLKGSAGVYHQPPRFVLPLPGLDLLPLKYGLVQSYQTSLGTEVPLEKRLSQPELGRAYGLEVLLRRQSKSGVFGWISYTLSRSEREQGSRSVPYDFDRLQIFNFVAGLPLARNWDLGLRGQYESGRPATILIPGMPATNPSLTTLSAGYNAARTDGYWRFDLRVDKRAVYRRWLLDFYVDITNAALLPEEVIPGTVLRYVLPTVGLRGRL